VPMFLRSIANVKLGQPESAGITEERRMMATTVIALIAHGDQPNLDLGDIAVGELAAATLQLCDRPQDQAAVDGFRSAAERFNEIQRSLDGMEGRNT